MATLRQRNPVQTSREIYEVDTDEEEKINTQTEHQQTKKRTEKVVRNGYDDDDEPFISLLDILRVILTLVFASTGLSYYMTSGNSLIWGYQRPWFTRWPLVQNYLKGGVNLTPTELALYDGTDPSLPIYLAINGTIFDVSANPGIYGPGGGYHFFSGRDATRAFVTGCFQDDLTQDMTGVEEMYIPIEDDDESFKERALSPREKEARREREEREAREKVVAQVQHWVNFFGGHRKYFAVGKVLPEGKRSLEKRVLCEGAQVNRPRRSDLNKVV